MNVVRGLQQLVHDLQVVFIIDLGRSSVFQHFLQ